MTTPATDYDSAAPDLYPPMRNVLRLGVHSPSCSIAPISMYPLLVNYVVTGKWSSNLPGDLRKVCRLLYRFPQYLPPQDQQLLERVDACNARHLGERFTSEYEKELETTTLLPLDHLMAKLHMMFQYAVEVDLRRHYDDHVDFCNEEEERWHLIREKNLALEQQVAHLREENLCLLQRNVYLGD